MLKDILKLEGVNSLSKKDQSTIFGGFEDSIDNGEGFIDKCCVKIPGQPTGGCNDNPKCSTSHCACKN